MVKEVINGRQGTNIMVLFILGSALVLSPGSNAGQDAWIVILLSVLMTIPVGFVFSRLNTIFPDKDLYDITEFVFGKVIGRALNVLYIWYAFHLGALVIRNFGEFIKVASMPETPLFILALTMGVFCIWTVRSGIEVLSRWATFICPIVIVVVLLINVLALPLMDFSNFKPILYNGFKPIFSNTFLVFSFPFAETVVFTTVLTSLRSKKDTFKVYCRSLIIGGAILLSASIRNIGVLGSEYAAGLYFPSYAAASLINISDFLQRIEVFIALNFLLGGIVKISICLYAACKGISKLLRLKDYKPLAAPIGFLMINLAILVYKNIMEMFDWAFKIYPYYAFPFQVVFPILLLIAAMVKLRLKPASSVNTKSPN